MTDIRLDGYMADDISVVNAARVSFGKYREVMDDSDIGLISFLMRNRHGTPFEHNSFRFHVRCPIFVAREWFRHRIGSFNEYSARYSVMDQGAWVPEPEDVRTQVGVPGSYSYASLPPDLQAEVVDVIQSANGSAKRTYQYLLEKGVAKEVARTVLPMGTFTEFYWTVNARSLMNFLSLRTDETAQKEIRVYAREVEVHFADKMPITYRAWNNNGRIAP